MRATQGWKASAATLKEASLEFTILYDTEDADFTAHGFISPEVLPIPYHYLHNNQAKLCRKIRFCAEKP